MVCVGTAAASGLLEQMLLERFRVYRSLKGAYAALVSVWIHAWKPGGREGRGRAAAAMLWLAHKGPYLQRPLQQQQWHRARHVHHALLQAGQRISKRLAGGIECECFMLRGVSAPVRIRQQQLQPENRQHWLLLLLLLGVLLPMMFLTMIVSS